jgi:hypothetical protein
MIETVDYSTFARRFKTLRSKNFSDEGLRALFEYLEEYEDSTGATIELDVIALCCEYTEYEDVHEYIKYNGIGVVADDYDTEEDYISAVKEEISDNHTVIDIDGEAFIVSE